MTGGWMIFYNYFMLDKPELRKLYKEFCRKKINKYKHKFPRLSESSIVTIIIKEWEHLNQT